MRLVSLPGHPSNGYSMDMAVRGEGTPYSIGLVKDNDSGKFMAWPEHPCCVSVLYSHLVKVKVQMTGRNIVICNIPDRCIKDRN